LAASTAGLGTTTLDELAAVQATVPTTTTKNNNKICPENLNMTTPPEPALAATD
jgi:hypothetical protein